MVKLTMLVIAYNSIWQLALTWTMVAKLYSLQQLTESTMFTGICSSVLLFSLTKMTKYLDADRLIADFLK